jgi:hypothetical protein
MMRSAAGLAGFLTLIQRLSHWSSAYSVTEWNLMLDVQIRNWRNAAIARESLY